MRVLVAEDDRATNRGLRRTLTGWGYEVQGASDGHEAWEALNHEDAPALVVLDWLMPGMAGIDVCRKVRATPRRQQPYIVMLTVRESSSDIAECLDAGADDYVTKPFDYQELRARVRVGERTVRLQSALADRVEELERALCQVSLLQGLLPICSYCKKIRDDDNYWHQVESYITQHSEAKFSHGICPACVEQIMNPLSEGSGQRSSGASGAF